MFFKDWELASFVIQTPYLNLIITMELVNLSICPMPFMLKDILDSGELTVIGIYNIKRYYVSINLSSCLTVYLMGSLWLLLSVFVTSCWDIGCNDDDICKTAMLCWFLLLFFF